MTASGSRRCGAAPIRRSRSLPRRFRDPEPAADHVSTHDPCGIGVSETAETALETAHPETSDRGEPRRDTAERDTDRGIRSERLR